MAQLTLSVSGVLVGYNLDYVSNACIELYDDGVIDVGVSCTPSRLGKRLEYSSYIAMVPLCNGHIHVLDYIVMDLGEELDLPSLVALPTGLKYRVISRKSLKELYDAAYNALKLAKSWGTLFAAIYGELGFKGSQVVNDVLSALDVTGIVLAQPEEKSLTSYMEVGKVFKAIGLDTLFDLPEPELQTLSSYSNKWFIHVHVSETYDLYIRRDYMLLGILKPRAAIHGTHWGYDDARILLDLESTWWVLCPRSNMLLVGRLPPYMVAYRLWRREGFRRIALGTDNAGWVPPLVHEEIRFSYITGLRYVDDPEEYARMLIYAATYGCIDMVGARIEPLESGSRLPTLLLVPVPGITYSLKPLRTIAKRGWIDRPLIASYTRDSGGWRISG